MKRLIKKLFFQNKLNILATLYINLKLFPLKVAIKTPVVIYGKWHLFDLSGTIEFTSPIQREMLSLGENLGGFVVTGKGSFRLSKGAKLIIGGGNLISQGAQICIKRNAILELVGDAIIGDKVKIICAKYIFMGKHTRLAWESQITDFNSHYIENINNKKIPTIYKPVIIGNNCWIGNRTSVMPGTVLPDWTIVGSNSLLNKDYKAQGLESYSLIGGSPAKLIGTGYKRIYDRKVEQELHNYFRQNEVNDVNSDDFLNNHNL